MHFLKIATSVLVLYILFLIGFSPLTGCTKTITEHDTTVKTIHDTTIKNIHDTTIKNIHDTIYDTLYCLHAGLIAYYNFNGGNLNDSSGYGNHIYFSNAVTKTADRFGRPNNAYYFDGINGQMRVHNSPSLNPTNITLVAIVNFQGFNSGICMANQILMKGLRDQDGGLYGLRVLTNNGSCSYIVDTTNEKLAGYYGDDFFGANGAFGANTPIHTNNWVTLVYTYDGYVHNVYINGELVGTNAVQVNFTPTANDLTIGRTYNDPFPYPFTGIMDEIRIYNRALSAAEVKYLNKISK